ncbi:MAG: phosphopantetheine-binding protein [Thermoanaerobaculia bacterium]|nr:phosphopantetheine-binding protein [Thermoanaerobaculia bacterium]
MQSLDRQTVTRRVQEILVEVLALDETPSSGDRLVEDLGAESVDVIALVFEFEDVFGRGIDDEVLARLRTVDDIVDAVLEAPDSPTVSGSES